MQVLRMSWGFAPWSSPTVNLTQRMMTLSPFLAVACCLWSFVCQSNEVWVKPLDKPTLVSDACQGTVFSLGVPFSGTERGRIPSPRDRLLRSRHTTRFLVDIEDHSRHGAVDKGRPSVPLVLRSRETLNDVLALIRRFPLGRDRESRANDAQPSEPSWYVQSHINLPCIEGREIGGSPLPPPAVTRLVTRRETDTQAYLSLPRVRQGAEWR